MPDLQKETCSTNDHAGRFCDGHAPSSAQGKVMREQFFRHLTAVLNRAQSNGLQIEWVLPRDCSNEQMRGMWHIIRGRKSRAWAVFKADGFTFLAYDDPRFEARIAYLLWQNERWASPGDTAFEVLSVIDKRCKPS